jgi:hypothetical protein
VSKHTPGPWIRKTSPEWWASHPIYKHVGLAIVGNGIPCDGGDGEWEVCWFGKGDPADPPDDIDAAYAEREEADARLIAAAPDLLAVAKLLAIAQQLPATDEVWAELYAKANAAIAKAEGDS